MAKYISGNPVMTSWEPSLSLNTFLLVDSFCCPSVSVPWEVHPWRVAFFPSEFAHFFPHYASHCLYWASHCLYWRSPLLYWRYSTSAEALLPFQRWQTGVVYVKLLVVVSRCWPIMVIKNRIITGRPCSFDSYLLQIVTSALELISEFTVWGKDIWDSETSDTWVPGIFLNWWCWWWNLAKPKWFSIFCSVPEASLQTLSLLKGGVWECRGSVVLFY